MLIIGLCGSGHVANETRVGADGQATQLHCTMTFCVSGFASIRPPSTSEPSPPFQKPRSGAHDPSRAQSGNGLRLPPLSPLCCNGAVVIIHELVLRPHSYRTAWQEQSHLVHFSRVLAYPAICCGWEYDGESPVPKWEKIGFLAKTVMQQYKRYKSCKKYKRIQPIIHHT